MKRILILLVIIGCSLSTKAQFPTTDSLRAFVNRYIRNSAVEAFQNLRLNTALIGMSRFLDSAYGGQVLSFTATNDSTARLITLGGDTMDVVIRGTPARFGLEDATTTANRSFNFNNFTFEADSFSNYNLYSKAQSSGVDRGVVGQFRSSPTSSYLWHYSTIPGSTRSYGINAYGALTQIFAAGHVPGHATYGQFDTVQVILEADPNRLYLFHDSVSLQNITGGAMDFRIRTLPETVDTSYKSLVSGPKGQVFLRAGGNGGGGGITDGDKGDITVSSSGSSWTIDNNAVTTSKIADLNVTNAKIDTFYTYPAQSTIGRVWYDTAFTNIMDFIPSGGPTIALSNAKIVVTNATAADAAQVAVRKYRATNSHNWYFRGRARATGRVVGFGPGLMSIYPGDNSGFHNYVGTTSSVFSMRSAVSGTTLATTGTSITVNDNDILEFTITRSDSVITSTVRNVTTSSSVITISKTYTAVSGGTLIPNDGYIHWVSFADNFEIISQEFVNNEVKNPVGLIIGDSKSDGYFSETFTQRYWVPLNAAYPNVVLSAGGGNKLAGVYNKLDEIYATNPEWVLLADIGRNDLDAGMTLDQFKIMFQDIYTKLSRGGQTRVYICMFPERYPGGSSIDLTAAHDWLEATYPNNYISAVWDDLSTGDVLDIANDAGDRVHLNAAGNAVVAASLIASGKLTTINSKRRSPYKSTDGNIVTTGDVLHLGWEVQRVPNYVMKRDTLNNEVPSIIHDDNSQLVISTKPITQTTGISSARVNVDGAIYASGSDGFIGIRDRTTSDAFGYISQGGVFQNLVNGTGKWFLDVNGLVAIGTNPAITGRARGIFNIWEDRTFPNSQAGKGLGFNLDNNTYSQASATLMDTVSIASFGIPTLQGNGSATTYTNPATLTIDGEPTAGTNTTLTTPWAFKVKRGNSYFGGKIFNPGADSVGTATGGYYFKDAATGEVKITAAPTGQVTLKGTLNWTPGSVGAGSSTSTTVSITGAVGGDGVIVTKVSGGYSNGEIYDAWVSAPGVVTVRVHNVSGGSANYSTATDYNVIVIKY